MEWLLLADVGSDLPTAASVIGAAGFSGVLAWYLVTKAIPKMQDQNAQSLKEITTAHALTTKDLADRFDRHLSELRSDSKDEYARFRESHKADSAETREAVRDLCNEIRSSTLGRRPPTTAPQS